MLLSAMRRRDDRERGVAMIAVVGLIAVLAVITSLIVVSLTAAQGFTSRSRTNVEAQSAAEAGIASARAALANGECQATATSSSAPFYTYTVEREASPDVWQAGCPTPTQRARIISTGATSAAALSRPTAPDAMRIEVVLSPAAQANLLPPSITPGAIGSIYSMAGAGGGAGLSAPAGQTATIVVRSGNYTCDGGASIGLPGRVNIVVGNGNLTLGGSCWITGSVWVPNGRITLPWSTGIDGHVFAAKELSFGGGSVTGSAWVDGPVTFTAGSLGGSLSAASLTSDSWNSVTIGGSVVVTDDIRILGGDKRIKGNVSATNVTLTAQNCQLGANAWVTNSSTLSSNGCTIAGKLTTRTQTGASGRVGSLDVRSNVPASPYTLPDPDVIPVIGPWTDYTYRPADWTGFQVVTLSQAAGDCANDRLQAAVDRLGGQKGVIDARGCTNGISVGGSTNVHYSNDVAIFANRFTFDGGASFTSTGRVNLWIVIPDTVEDGAPTCTPSRTTPTLGGGATFGPQITVMVYSPCEPSISINMTGEVYSKTAGLSGSTKLTLSEIVLPGLDVIAGGGPGGGENPGAAPGGSASESAGRDVQLQRRIAIG